MQLKVLVLPPSALPTSGAPLKPSLNLSVDPTDSMVGDLHALREPLSLLEAIDHRPLQARDLADLGEPEDSDSGDLTRVRRRSRKRGFTA